MKGKTLGTTLLFNSIYNDSIVSRDQCNCPLFSKILQCKFHPVNFNFDIASSFMLSKTSLVPDSKLSSQKPYARALVLLQMRVFVWIIEQGQVFDRCWKSRLGMCCFEFSLTRNKRTFRVLCWDRCICPLSHVRCELLLNV